MAEKKRQSQSRSSSNGSASKSVSKAADKARGSLGDAASKAKVPLVAGGAALAGAAGGFALAASKKGRKGVGLKSGDLAKAAKEVGNFSAQVGELATELQRARESARNGRHRSPIEVVLQGLTARR